MYTPEVMGNDMVFSRSQDVISLSDLTIMSVDNHDVPSHSLQLLSYCHSNVLKNYDKSVITGQMDLFGII